MTTSLLPANLHNVDGIPPPSVFLTPFSPESMGESLRAANGAALASATYITAQKALYFPFILRRRVTVYRFFWVNGTTASTNNIQVGVYDANANAVKLGTSTLAAGPSVAQFDNITDTVLPKGRYYLAIWCSGTTTHMARAALTARFFKGSYEQASLASGLPTPTATFATQTAAYVPLFGLALRASP